MKHKWPLIALASLVTASCDTAQIPPAPKTAIAKTTTTVQGPFVAPDEVVKKIQIGMSEGEVVKLLKPLADESGTFYWGGSGRHTLYFAFSSFYEKRQLAVDFGEGPHGVVERVSRLHPKTKWTRHDGDSITVDMNPPLNEFKAD